MGVYFIDGGNGLVKIGKSNNIQERLKALQSMSPVKLGLLEFFECDDHIEKRLHDVFSVNRKHGEWFVYCDNIKDLISQISKQDDPEDATDIVVKYINNYYSTIKSDICHEEHEIIITITIKSKDRADQILELAKRPGKRPDSFFILHNGSQLFKKKTGEVTELSTRYPLILGFYDSLMFFAKQFTKIGRHE